MPSIIIGKGNSNMKNKIAITILGLAVVLSVVACGNKESLAESTETNSIVEDSETIDTEVVATESIDTTDVTESETEVSNEVADIVATLEEQGYKNIDVELIELLLYRGYDPLDTRIRDDYEIAKFTEENLPGEGLPGKRFQDWAIAQGADYALGWSFVYKNGKGAGSQPTYAVYMNENSPLYGTVYHVGDILPNGSRLDGTRDENFESTIEETKEQFVEDGGKIYVDEETGKTIWEIP